MKRKYNFNIMHFSLFYFLIYVFFMQVGCSSLGETDLAPLVYSDFTLKKPIPNLNAPGNGSNAGPASANFWVQDRRTNAASALAGFYQVGAERLAYSEHFVIYRETSQASLMNATNAQNLLNKLEPSYNKLKSLYSINNPPQLHFENRSVILATDIKDDYALVNPLFLAGFFSPRDLYSDDYTTALYTDPVIINETDVATITSLRGHSNENLIIYLDLDPFYNGAAYNGDTTKTHALAAETVIHETSHLFTYHYRVELAKIKNHDFWIAEGIADISPLVTSTLIENQKERMRQYATPLIQSYLAYSPSLFDTTKWGDTLTGYLQANLFMNYIRHRAASASSMDTLMTSIVKQDDPGIAGMSQTIVQEFKGDGFSYGDLFKDWVLSTYVAAHPYTLQSYIDESGTNIPLGNGTYPSKKYLLSYAGVGISNASSSSNLQFQPNSIPISYQTDSICLEPSSYVIYPYRIPAGTTLDYTPTASGMQSGLKLAMVAQDTTNSAIRLREYNISSTIPLSSTVDFIVGTEYHFIIANPSTSGSCLNSGTLKIDTRNIASWAGAASSSWQYGPGATNNSNGSYFKRTSAIALSLKNYPNLASNTNNYAYVTDYLNHGISRWNLDTATYAGRMGSTIRDTLDATCTSDSSAKDGWSQSSVLYPHYCLRSFNSPRGIATDSTGNIYIADSNNNRIVKRDKNGNFISWLGHSSSDEWQCEAGNSYSDCIGRGILAPLNPTSMSTINSDTKMLAAPWGLAIDESGPTAYLYIATSGTNRISRRNLTTGQFLGFIGNSHTGWDTSTPILFGSAGSSSSEFNKPKGIAIDSSYIYIADAINHRISRWTLSGFPAGAIGGSQLNWHNLATPSSSDIKSFKSPSAVAVDSNYLYITDQLNYRIVRWPKLATTNPGWVGGGESQWSANSNSPILPSSPANQYPPNFLLEPNGLAIGTASIRGSKHDYLYVTTVYNARITRWNMDCINDNTAGDCSGD